VRAYSYPCLLIEPCQGVVENREVAGCHHLVESVRRWETGHVMEAVWERETWRVNGTELETCWVNVVENRLMTQKCPLGMTRIGSPQSRWGGA
jgi:hypothetical protein